jgi:hypothetical protein
VTGVPLCELHDASSTAVATINEDTRDDFMQWVLR